jgi:hypothetical protein
MDLSEVLKELDLNKKILDSVFASLKEVKRLDQNRIANIRGLLAKLSGLKKILKTLPSQESCLKAIHDWSEQYEQELAQSTKEIKERFGIELESQLKALGINLTGQYPELRAQLFTIELDFEAGIAVLWFGPKQERLGQTSLEPEKVAKSIERARQDLGCGLPTADFLTILRSAYERLVAKEPNAVVPIIQMLSQMAYALQDARFNNDPRREYYKSYGRADFSYDLFRLMHSQRDELFGNLLHLSVATRSQTNRRQDFLWIPDDVSGKGTMYSQLQFREGRK